MEATLQEILDAREARVQKQQHLLQTYGKSLVCFTMNIPGPVKLDRDVSIGFFVGCRLLKDSLAGRLIYAEEQKKHPAEASAEGDGKQLFAAHVEKDAKAVRANGSGEDL